MRATVLVCLLALLPLGSSLASEPPSAPSSEPGSEVPFVNRTLTPGLPQFEPLARQNLASPAMAVIPIPNTEPAVSMTFVQGTQDGATNQWLLQTFADNTKTLRRLPELLVDGKRLTLLVPLEPKAVPARKLDLGMENGHLVYRWLPYTNALSIGRPMPAFQVANLEGQTLPSTHWRGQWTVYDWWAISCAPCIAAMPKLNALRQRFADKPVHFVGVALETPEALREFLESREFLFEQTLVIDESTEVFGNTFPRTVLVDPQGIVRFDRLGFFDTSELDVLLEESLETAASGPQGSNASGSR